MTSNKTILIISYYFAPSAAVGGKRFSFLARELERRGYRVHVVAAVNDSDQHGNGMLDPSLPTIQSVHRCAAILQLPLSRQGLFSRAVNWLARRLLAAVGMELFWAGPATRKALKLVRGAPGGVVIATAPPWTAAIVGRRVSKRLGWPLILDYRDTWSGYPKLLGRKGKLAYRVARWIESRCIAQSSARVLNTPEMSDWYEKYFPSVGTDRNYVVPNGIEAIHHSSDSTAPASMEIVHAGAIYTQRSLVPVVRALAQLVGRKPQYQGLRVVTYGPMPEQEHKRVEEEGLRELLEVRPRVTRDRLFQALKEARMLLVVSGADMGYSIPYKTYDYLAAGRPILALTPRGTALERFASELEHGAPADPSDPDSVYGALDRLLALPNVPPSPQTLQKHLWPNLASRYVDVIETVLNDAVTERRNRSPSAAT